MHHQLAIIGDISSQLYFQHLRESNLSHYDKSLEGIWLSSLKAHREQTLEENEHPADYPSKYVDDHFVGFNVMRFILFLICLFSSKVDLRKVTLETMEKMWEKSLKMPLLSLNVWRIYWGNISNNDYLLALSHSDKYIFDIGFKTNVKKLLENFETLFPLQLNALLNEHLMKPLRVLFHLLKQVRSEDTDFVSFFQLHESSEDLELFYERIAHNSSYDRKIVQYVSLKYESVLNCKRKIEEAKDGDFIAVKVYLQTKIEVLRSLEDDQNFIRDKITLLTSKVEDAKLELFGLNYSYNSFNGMSARKVASKLLEKSKQTKELNEYVVRKTAVLRNLNFRLLENKEQIYIAKQYDI